MDYLKTKGTPLKVHLKEQFFKKTDQWKTRGAGDNTRRQEYVGGAGDNARRQEYVGGEGNLGYFYLLWLVVERGGWG